MKACEMAGMNLDIEREDVASGIVRYIADEDELIEEYVKSVNAGVKTAIEEIDDVTYVAVNDAIRAATAKAVKAQATRLALRLMRDWAARSGQETDAPF